MSSADENSFAILRVLNMVLYNNMRFYSQSFHAPQFFSEELSGSGPRSHMAL